MITVSQYGTLKLLSSPQPRSCASVAIATGKMGNTSRTSIGLIKTMPRLLNQRKVLETVRLSAIQEKIPRNLKCDATFTSPRVKVKVRRHHNLLTYDNRQLKNHNGNIFFL